MKSFSLFLLFLFIWLPVAAIAGAVFAIMSLPVVIGSAAYHFYKFHIKRKRYVV